MFDVSWSEFLILVIVTLIFVGPKELPVFLGTIGRYAGMVRKQAAEFRRHFDDAMREAELDQMRNDVEALTRDVNDSVMSATRAAETEVKDAKAALSSAVAPTPAMPLSEAAPAALKAPASLETPASPAEGVAVVRPLPSRTAPEHG